MKHETQVEILQHMLELRETDKDQETTKEIVKIPVRNYIEPDVLDQELSTLYKDYPLVAGHASSVREPGSYILSDWKKFPYVIVRDKHGVLRGFLNICQHRGARLVSGTEKELKAFVCPYHGWAYNLDGSLMAVTRDASFPGLDCSKLGLQELPVAEHMGLIWIHPTPGASIDIPSYVGDEISSNFEHFGFDKLVVHRKKTVTKYANWKLLVKTYLDRYHVPILHRNSIGEYFKKGVIAHLLHGPNIRMAAGRTNLPDAAKVDKASWKLLDYASVFYTLFPNTYVIFHDDIVSMNTFYPESPDRTIWTHHMLYKGENYIGKERQSGLAKRFSTLHTVFESEDFGISENSQLNLHYGSEFHTLGLEEGLLAIFQENIDEILNKVVD